MGYAVYEDRPAKFLGVNRWAGYGVPAVCDVADCTEEIHRGMGYRCETWWDYPFDEDTEEEAEIEQEGCFLHFCDVHLDHNAHGENVTPKPDTEEWVRFLLTDESWELWRNENPDTVKELRTFHEPVKGDD